MAETMVALAVSEEREKEIETRRSALVEAAEALVIDDSDAEAVGWDIVNRIDAMKKLIEHDFKVSKSASYSAWKAVCSQEAGHLKRLEEPNKIVRGKLAEWDAAKMRLLRAAEDAARANAEADRKRAQAEADERAKQVAEERRLQEALAAELAGNAEVAQAILEQPITVPHVEISAAVVPTMVLPKVEGAGAMVEVWKWEVADEKDVPREFLMVDTAKLGRYVTAMKGDAKVAGVRVWSEREARRVGKRFGAETRRADATPR